MSKVNLSNQLIGSGKVDAVEFNGGVIPGVSSTDALGQTPVQFTVQSLTTGVLSGMSQSFLANTTNISQVAPVLGKVIQELIRKRILDGSYSA